MTLTEEQKAKLLSNIAHIPISEIEQDKRDTQKEIDNYNDELEILMRNPPDNKVKIYLAQGNVNKRESLLKKLNMILELRKKDKEVNKDAGGV